MGSKSKTKSNLQSLGIHLDCQTCGACCGSLYPHAGFVDLLAHDIARLERGIGKQQVHLQIIDSWMPAIKTDRIQGVTRCRFLGGTIGESVACAVYNHRPEQCREIRPGSQECMAAREELLGRTQNA